MSTDEQERMVHELPKEIESLRKLIFDYTSESVEAQLRVFVSALRDGSHTKPAIPKAYYTDILFDIFKPLIHKERRDAAYSGEYWKPIKGYEQSYEVSTCGRIRSIPRATTKGGILKPAIQPSGYCTVSLSKPGAKHATALVHRLVASAFLLNPEGYREVNHLDGNKQNNMLSNLEWTDHLGNSLHAFKLGLTNQTGSRNNAAKLTEVLAEEIRRSPTRTRQLAKKYGVSDSTIRNIRRGAQWKHLSTLQGKEGKD